MGTQIQRPFWFDFPCYDWDRNTSSLPCANKYTFDLHPAAFLVDPFATYPVDTPQVLKVLGNLRLNATNGLSSVVVNTEDHVSVTASNLALGRSSFFLDDILRPSAIEMTYV